MSVVLTNNFLFCLLDRRNCLDSRRSHPTLQAWRHQIGFSREQSGNLADMRSRARIGHLHHLVLRMLRSYSREPMHGVNREFIQIIWVFIADLFSSPLSMPSSCSSWLLRKSFSLSMHSCILKSWQQLLAKGSILSGPKCPKTTGKVLKPFMESNEVCNVAVAMALRTGRT